MRASHVVPNLKVEALMWERLLKSISSVDSRLPYNWNWQRDWTVLDSFLQKNPIVLMDVGARGAAPPELESLRGYLHRIGFEPDPGECARLNRSDEGIFFPNLVAASTGRETLNLYERPGYSSVLGLSERYQRFWTGQIRIDRAIECQAVRIDEILDERPDLSPDILKVDTQGAELAVLKGAEKSIDNIGLVELEVEFMRIYEQQPLFGDIAQMLDGAGFELLYLNRVFASRRNIYSGPSRGQVIYGDALFGKREDNLGTFNVVQRAKYVILLCQYGHMDLAWQVFNDSPEVQRLLPELGSVFKNRPPNPFKRFALMQLDKLLTCVLHARRYNQRGTDNDRAWPIR